MDSSTVHFPYPLHVSSTDTQEIMLMQDPTDVSRPRSGFGAFKDSSGIQNEENILACFARPSGFGLLALVSLGGMFTVLCFSVTGLILRFLCLTVLLG